MLQQHARGLHVQCTIVWQSCLKQLYCADFQSRTLSLATKVESLPECCWRSTGGRSLCSSKCCLHCLSGCTWSSNLTKLLALTLASRFTRVIGMGGSAAAATLPLEEGNWDNLHLTDFKSIFWVVLTLCSMQIVQTS